MSGNTFMIGNGFVIDERTLGKVRGSDHHSARAFAVRRAGHIVGCRRGVEGGYGFHRDRRLGKKREQGWKFRLHLCDVAAEIVEDLFGGVRKVLWDCFLGAAEGNRGGATFSFWR